MRVLVGEDRLLTREGIITLLGRAGVGAVGEAGDVEGTPALVERHRPVAVHSTSACLPGTLTRACGRRRDLPAMAGYAGVILSQYVEVGFVLALLESNTGSVGYLVKEWVLEMAMLSDALRRVSACA